MSLVTGTNKLVTAAVDPCRIQSLLGMRLDWVFFYVGSTSAFK
jgi:hypothetical protein